MTKKTPTKKTVVNKKAVNKPVKTNAVKSKTNPKSKVLNAKSSQKKSATILKETKKNKTKPVVSKSNKPVKKATNTQVAKSKKSEKVISKKNSTKNIIQKTAIKKSTKSTPKVKKKATKQTIKKAVSKTVALSKKAPITTKINTELSPKESKEIKKERKNNKKIIPTIPVPKPIASNLPIDKKPRVKNILISQPFPENGKSPFIDIAQKWKVKVDFRTFIKVEGLSAKEFRRLKIYITDYSAIIFNSRNAIDYFFKLCEEMRVKLSQEMKYFCTSEAIALYLQKYIQYRKRKVFFDQPGRTLFDLINRFKDTEKFLYPCSRDRKDDIPNFLKDKKVNYAEAYIYQTVASDLSDLRNIKYDMIVFFSPIGIKSLFYNYPDFIQDDRRIGGFGQVTWDAIADAGLRLDIVAPSPAAASMAQAIENYLKESNK